MFVIPEIDSIQLSPHLISFHQLSDKCRQTNLILQAFYWKHALPQTFPPIYVLAGGTGIGKSTLFNSLIGENISRVTPIRPCTDKAIFFVHERFRQAIVDCPFVSSENSELIFHEDNSRIDIVLVDTPDYDSNDQRNRTIFEYSFLICDLLIFATSQEKYADMKVHEIGKKARIWKKSVVSIFNKSIDEDTWLHFCELWDKKKYPGPRIRIERRNPPPQLIPNLTARPEFACLYNPDFMKDLKAQELLNITKQASLTVKQFKRLLKAEIDYICNLNDKMNEFFESSKADMLARSQISAQKHLDDHIQDKLRILLQKYDPFSKPRSYVRDTIKSIGQKVGLLIQGGSTVAEDTGDNGSGVSGLFMGAKNVADLKPLEEAVNSLNKRIAAYFEEIEIRSDLKAVAAQIPRWKPEDLKQLYDDEFPGIEKLLEDEFAKLKEGLTTKDEIKLYGSSLFATLLLISMEFVVGGGFSLLDAVLDTAIVPFITKFSLDAKIISVLREIGQRLDIAHKKALEGILYKQAQLYIDEFNNVKPSPDSLDKLTSLQNKIKNMASNLA